jgi:hypothetical protein
MTDFEKFIDTYKQFGIELDHYEDDDGNLIITLNDEHQQEQKIFGGYRGFFSILKFTKHGKFLGQSFFE